MQRVHQDEDTHEPFLLDLDQIGRQGAQMMLASVLEAEVDAYLQLKKSATRTDRRWWSGTVRPGAARLSVGQAQSRLRLLGSTTGG